MYDSIVGISYNNCRNNVSMVTYIGKRKVIAEACSLSIFSPCADNSTMPTSRSSLPEGYSRTSCSFTSAYGSSPYSSVSDATLSFHSSDLLQDTTHVHSTPHKIHNSHFFILPSFAQMISAPHRPQSGRSFLLCFCRSTPNLCIFPIRTILPSSLNIFQNYGVTSDPRISAMTTVRWNLVSSVVSPAMCCGISTGADRADPLPGSSPYSVLSSIRRMILHLYKKSRQYRRLILFMAGVLGFEPRKCQIQSLVPYRLAIPQ